MLGEGPRRRRRRRSSARCRACRWLGIGPGLQAESRAATIAAEALAERGVPESEHVATLEADAKEWEDSGDCPERLAHAIKRVVAECAGGIGEKLSGRYLGAHTQLTRHGELGAGDARHLLSSARLVAHLLEGERMSCAQTARVLSAPFGETRYTWPQIRILCEALHISEPEVTPAEAEQIFDSDSLEQTSRFADSTDDVEHEQLVKHAGDLGFYGDEELVLSRFTSEDFDPAMRVIAHFMLTVCEYYDHPPSVAYEFKPRGRACRFLQDQHPTYREMGAAILNVAKGAQSLDDNWAWGRMEDRRSDALALSALFMGLEQMPYHARRELATWLRQWIVRTYERAVVERIPLDLVESSDQALSLVEALIANETHTAGVIEQRVVDALTTVLHPHSTWHSRGLGDAVNAANLPRNKMGDCEYLRPGPPPSIVAYEAHAGTPNALYLQSHQRSLNRVIEQRSADLEALAKPNDWKIRVRFVAHMQPRGPFIEDRVVFGYQVCTEAITYEQLLESVHNEAQQSSGAVLVEKVNEHLIEPLNMPAWASPRIVETSSMRRRCVTSTTQVRSGVQGRCCADRPGDAKADL